MADTGFFGDVTERSIPVISVQRIGKFSSQCSAPIIVNIFQPATIDEVNIKPAVSVIVKEHCSGAGALDNVAEVKVTIAMLEFNTRLPGHIGKNRQNLLCPAADCNLKDRHKY